MVSSPTLHPHRTVRSTEGSSASNPVRPAPLLTSLRRRTFSPGFIYLAIPRWPSFQPLFGEIRLLEQHSSCQLGNPVVRTVDHFTQRVPYLRAPRLGDKCHLAFHFPLHQHGH